MYAQNNLIKHFLFNVSRAVLLFGISSFADLRVLNFDLVETTAAHDGAIADSRLVFDSLAAVQNWQLTQSNDIDVMTDSVLENFDVIIFNNNGGDIFADENKLALQNFIQNGGGIAGIHSATYMHKTPGEWPWWEDLIGKLHLVGPGPGNRGYPDTVVMQDTTAHFTRNQPGRWVAGFVEWYQYSRELPDSVHVIATALVQETLPDYPEYYPITWCQHFDGGRSWYTNLGHYSQNFTNPDFIHMLLNGIDFAADKNAGGCGKPQATSLIRVPDSGRNNSLQLITINKNINLHFNILGQNLTRGTSHTQNFRRVIIE